MPTTFDLKLALNAEIGSVPLSLHAEVDKEADKDIYRFDGSIQDFDISLGDFFTQVGQQFGVSTPLPPELNSADFKIDYLVGQVILTKSTDGSQKSTQLGVSGKFELTVDDFTLVWEFFAASNPGAQTPTPYVIGFALDLDMVFADLPVIGNVPGLKDLVLTKIGFTYTNVDAATKTPVNFAIPSVTPSDNPLFTGSKDSDAKNAKTYAITGDGQNKQFTLNQQGFSLTVGLQNKATNEQLNNFALPLGSKTANSNPSQPGQPAPGFAPGKTSVPDSPAHWIDINKTFGPVNLRKIGLNYSDGEATFGFSAGFSVAAFVLDIEGLTITFPLPLPLPGKETNHDVSFDLQGLGMDFKNGSLEIGGGFLKSIDDQKRVNYYGEVIVKAGPFGFIALGGYAPGTQQSPASFFLYANIDIPLGGPPFFFVTGIAAGFGINRNLLLPTIDEMPYYPLLPHNAPQPPAGQTLTPKDSLNLILPSLARIFANRPGEFWVAAGIQFTSFEMIDAFALVTVEFGVEFQLALMGECSMTFPKGDTEAPLAYLEVDILVTVMPAIGRFALDGRLTTNSTLFDGLCHISGGFSFYFWFGGPNQGDFVVSLGGYHPAFVKPPNYPDVPRIRIDLGLGPFHIGGESYFALTPCMMMAGMRVYATFNAGPVKVWFNAGFDFLLSWAPFHYEADAYVNLGISLDLGLFTLTLQFGVDLEMWGPAFGGLAHVDLWIFSFTIQFGADHATPPPIDWADFDKSFLPADSKKQPPVLSRFSAMAMADDPPATVNKITAGVAVGLLQENAGDYVWIVNPEHFVINLKSVIPSNIVKWNDSETIVPNGSDNYDQPGSVPFLKKPDKYFSEDQKLIWNPELHIGPMKKDNIQSFFIVNLLKDEEGGGTTALQDFTVEPVVMDVPQSLWGKTLDLTDKNPNKPLMVPMALVGLLISPIPRHPDNVSNVLLAILMFQQQHKTQFVHSALVDSNFTASGTVSSDPVTHTSILTITVSSKTPIQPPPPTLPPNTAYQLSALENSWIADRRSSILDKIPAAFQTWASTEVNLTDMAQKALTDWPAIGVLGA